MTRKGPGEQSLARPVGEVANYVFSVSPDFAFRLGAAAGFAVAEEPAFGGPDAVQVFERQAVALEPRRRLGFHDLVDLADAVGRLAASEALAGRGAFLEEVFFPERPAAQHAA